MLNQAPRVQVDQADWPTLLPFLRLFRGFRMAIHPSKILLALMLVILTYVGGLGMDLIWGGQVQPNEVRHYLTSSSTRYDQWLHDQTSTQEQAGVFETTLRYETGAFKRMIVSATRLNFGISGFLSGDGFRSGGVLGALAVMILGIPGWLYTTHPAFLAVFLTYAFLLTALFGGAISRLAAVQATHDLRRAHSLHCALPRYAIRGLCWRR